MAAKSKNKSTEPLPRWYCGANVPMRVIRRFAREVAKRFHPEKIILFGSYAYGTPHEDSDVDILVVMPTRDQIGQSVRIRMALDPPPFPLDLIVRTPAKLRRRLAIGDTFLGEIVEGGKVLYEKGNAGVCQESRGRLPHSQADRSTAGQRT
jgi:predicted nucleotidyltransferase